MAIHAHSTLCAQFAVGEGPAIYAVVAEGDCMVPMFNSGDALIVSTTAIPQAGDIVIVHIKPEFIKPGGFEAYVKRLRHNLFGAKFPYDASKCDVIIPLSLEQLNPPQRYNIPYDHIAAVHKVLGAGERAETGEVRAPRKMLEAA